MANAAILRLKSVPLPLATALMTGISIVLIVFMLPAELLEALVAQSGLPAFLGAAEPPLGTTARGLIALTGGVAMAAATWVLLRALEGLPNIRLPRLRRGANGALFARTEASPPKRAEPEFQRRRPILAGSDLGAPFHSVKAAEPVPAKKLVDTILTERVVVPEPEEAVKADESDLDWLLAPEPVAAAAPEPVAPDVAPEPEIAPEPVEDVIPEVAAPEPIAQPAPVEQRPLRDESIAALVQRFEAGIERRRLAVVSSNELPAAPDVPVPDPEPMTPDIDAALRDALGTLQRMSARGR